MLDADHEWLKEVTELLSRRGDFRLREHDVFRLRELSRQLEHRNALLAACEAALKWFNMQGEMVSPKSQLRAAIAQAKGEA